MERVALPSGMRDPRADLLIKLARKHKETGMPDYHVSWDIDIVADDPVAAAIEAKSIQMESINRAVVFDVSDGKETIRVDLENHTHRRLA